MKSNKLLNMDNSKFLGGGRGLILRPISQKGGLDGISIFRGGVAEKEGVTFFREEGGGVAVFT